MSRDLDEHRQYLSDGPRVEAFRRAIAEVVRPGDVVVDLGAGSGVLGFLACEAGAGRVYAIDSGSILTLARQLAIGNGWGDRIVHAHETSTRAVMPEPIDVIVTDQVGHFGMEAGLIEFLRDGARRWLKPGGRTVPRGVDLWVAAVESGEQRDRVEFWSGRPSGIDVSAAYHTASNSGYPADIDPEWLLTGGARIISLDLSPRGPDMFRGEAELTIGRSGHVDGLAGWFTAALSPSVTMTNAPGHPQRIHRRQAFLPIVERPAVAQGDTLRVSIVTRPAELIVTWTVTLTRRGAGPSTAVTFRHSTFDGMLLSARDLHRSRPDFVPSLTPAGLARRSVLELCDGARGIADIEREMRARHADLLPDAAAAATFVAEVLAVYAH
ncbi:MAG: 50S ribosomal protein L11 methyltransferase [Acidobacteria bacterium]|nr:50S ribosomal protein L11 methyltransferase [Acidobacteriota bacterium]